MVSRDFVALFECLNRHEVKAIIVGAHAIAFHAKPRYTKDIDVLIEPSSDNAERVLQALDDFGFGSVGLSVEDFTQPGIIVQLGYEPNRVDLLTSISGVPFEQAWEHRVEGLFGDQPVYYLGLQDLRLSKKAAGRLQDLADLDMLEGFGD